MIKDVYFAEIGECINFVEIGGKFINCVWIWGICNMHHWLRGDGCPCSKCVFDEGFHVYDSKPLQPNLNHLVTQILSWAFYRFKPSMNSFLL